MYSDIDTVASLKRRNRYRNILIASGLCCTIGSGLFLYFRLLLPIIIWTIIIIGVMIFFFDHYYAKERLYGKFLQNMRDGRKREIVGRFQSEDITTRDGLYFRRWLLDTDDGDIVLYYDINKTRKRPDEGALLRCETCENYIFSENEGIE